MKVEKNRLFTDTGYYDMKYIIENTGVFTLIIGARGTGKTYGALRYLIDNPKKFLIIRRTGTELDIAVNEKRNPFQVFSPSVKAVKIEKNFLGFSLDEGETFFGYASALSTFHNLRSVNFDDIELIVYDECIPESHVKSIKNEFNVILNMYETVNRNREMQGKLPVKLIMMSNSNDINSPIIQGLKIADKIVNSPDGVYIDAERSLCVLSLTNQNFKEKKQVTALYKLTDSKSRFAKMALDNAFSGYNLDGIKKVNLKEYVALCGIEYDGEIIYFLSHKSNGTYFFTDKNIGGDVYIYDFEVEQEKQKFFSAYYFIPRLIMANLCFYNNLTIKLLVDNLLSK